MRVVRERTSFELAAGDEDVGAGGQRDRVRAEVDEAGEALAAREREHRRRTRGSTCRSPSSRPGRAAAQAQAGAVEASIDVGSLGLRRDGERAPSRRAGRARRGPRPSRLKPYGGSAPDPRQRDPAAVAAGIDARPSGATSGPGAARTGCPRPRAGRAPRPGRRTSSPAAPSRAARLLAPGGCRAPGRSACRRAWTRTRTRCRPGRTASPGRVTSWFESTQVAGAPTGRVRGERRLDRCAHRGRLPRAGEEVEVERGVQLVRAQIAGEPLRRPAATPRRRARAARRSRRRSRASCGRSSCSSSRSMNGCSPGPLSGVSSASAGILDEQRRRVDPHAGDAAVEPEAKDVLVLGPHVRVRPVEVGLLGREEVEVPLAGCAVVSVRVHAGPPKIDCQPFGGTLAVRPCARAGTRSAPARATRAAAASAARNHGCWLGDVVRDDVDDRADPERARLGDQLLGLLERAERRVDRPVVRRCRSRCPPSATDTRG